MHDSNAPADAGAEGSGQALPEALRLTAVEARVLACLIEKEAITPEQYPLTENALTLACNQKTNREPLMDLPNGEVGHALRQLEARQLVRSQHGSRAQRWSHRMTAGYDLTAAQQAILCVLILRGPQTVAEITSRSERIGQSGDSRQVQHALERLAQRQLVQKLPRAGGQREERWVHLLSGPVDVAAMQAASQRRVEGENRADADLAARVAALEARVAALEARLSLPGAAAQ